MALPPLYAILDVSMARSRGWTPADLARAFFDGGARLLQIRAKDEPSGAWLALCEQIVAMAGSYGSLVIVNDRADLARLCGAAGVHVGQDDLPVGRARDLVGAEAVVGLSTHSESQLLAGLNEPATYLAVGPVFHTGTKDTGYEALGLETLRRACLLGGARPIVAIGGITLDRAVDVMAAGAHTIAVITDLLETDDPSKRVREYLDRLAR